MPELPEIALYKKYLDTTALHQKIRKVEVLDDYILKCREKELKNALEGEDLSGTKQIGKYLFAKTTGNKVLVLHFGMTGELEYYGDREAPDYSRVIFHLEKGYHLAYICSRKLGFIDLADSIEDYQKEKDLGRHALEFKKKEFENYLQNKRGSLKSALTDQSSIAGIGNVYADEIAFQCDLHPKSNVPDLSKKDRDCLYQKMKEVLETVIDKDAKRSEFPAGYLTPRREDGAGCPRRGCGGTIRQIKVSGRSTYFCDKHQL